MLATAENLLVVAVVAVIDAAIFLVSPVVGLFALVVTVPVTGAILLWRP